ncbi:hypothetical protein LEP1GSC080_0068 [Leptospira interrogans str. FPW2026]|nr:hypothetical protein LEP1GSC080_0068 [Leptospira interrogans str. FPW2026]
MKSNSFEEFCIYPEEKRCNGKTEKKDRFSIRNRFKNEKNDSFLNRKCKKPEENFLKPFLFIHFLKKSETLVKH